MSPLTRQGSFNVVWNRGFCTYSKSDGAFSIDLHGLTLEEAKRVATDRTQMWHASQNYGQSVSVVPCHDEPVPIKFLHDLFV